MSGTFPTINWDPGSQTGYRVFQEVHQTYAGAYSMSHRSDRPRRFWSGQARVPDATFTTIKSLYSTNVANDGHTAFTLADPWKQTNYDVIFTAQPQGVVTRDGYVDAQFEMEEDAGASYSAGSSGAYPSLDQARGSRELPGDRLQQFRYAYGGVEVQNEQSAARRRLAIIHTLLSRANLITLMEHYEDNWAGTFSLDFDLTGETGLTAGYAGPPSIGQVQGLFRVSNTFWL